MCIRDSFHTKRTLPAYSFSIWFSVGSTRLQNGHWKSEKMMTWRGAAFGPFDADSPAATAYTFVSAPGPLSSPPAGAAGAAGTSGLASFRIASYTFAFGVPLETR